MSRSKVKKLILYFRHPAIKINDWKQLLSDLLEIRKQLFKTFEMERCFEVNGERARKLIFDHLFASLLHKISKAGLVLILLTVLGFNSYVIFKYIL
jgi:hypothetical protein